MCKVSRRTKNLEYSTNVRRSARLEYHGYGVGVGGQEDRRQCYKMTLGLLDHICPAGGQGMGIKNGAIEEF